MINPSKTTHDTQECRFQQEFCKNGDAFGSDGFLRPICGVLFHEPKANIILATPNMPTISERMVMAQPCWCRWRFRWQNCWKASMSLSEKSSSCVVSLTDGAHSARQFITQLCHGYCFLCPQKRHNNNWLLFCSRQLAHIAACHQDALPSYSKPPIILLPCFYQTNDRSFYHPSVLTDPVLFRIKQVGGLPTTHYNIVVGLFVIAGL